jgi:hypothetical protein
MLKLHSKLYTRTSVEGSTQKDDSQHQANIRTRHLGLVDTKGNRPWLLNDHDTLLFG